MNKKVSKFIKYSVYSILIISLIAVIAFFTVFYTSNKVKFDSDKIISSNLSVNIFDSNNVAIRELNQFNGSSIKINSLPYYIKECFISIEDKEFYKHSGLNYKRMTKALLSNIKSMKIKEGASTISQQLIKNTHLSNEKTFRRKFNEIHITKQLEKEFTKDEIIEAYLNIIYFGNNCYGIENASEYYFSKNAKNLTIDECSVLAGLIKSPSYYCPIRHPERALKRRNLVIREMYKDKKLSYEEMSKLTNKNLELNINKQKNDRLNTYSEIALSEAMKILKCPAKQIALGDYKIYTYKDEELQENLKKSIIENSPNCDYCAISISKEGFIEAFEGSSNYKIIDNRRQPGSVIKPVLVYAPALNENIITNATEILDEPININGYKPNNIGNKFNGYVSCKESLSKSLNVPTIKILSYIGIDKAKSYATKCGINFSIHDTGYSIGLGGMTNGTNIIEMTGSYLPFINSGLSVKPTTIKYITDKNGKIVYKNPNEYRTVFRDDTAYLVTDSLMESTKTGTSKIMKDLDFEVAAKSGTVGIKNKNYDAWNIAFTSNNITGVWLGNMDNTPIDYVGGGLPAKICKHYYQKIYKDNKPDDFTKPSSISELEIDALELRENHRVVKANDYTPDRYRQKEIFSRFNEPKEISQNFISLEKPIIKGNISNNKANIVFVAKDYLIYELYKVVNNKNELCQVVSGKNGEVTISENIDKNKIVSYYLISKLKNFTNNTEIISEKSNVIELISTNSSNMLNNSNTSKNKWYI